MKDIRSIYNYDSSYDLLSETFGPEVFDDLTPDERDYVQCIDEYEGLTFYVINDDTVLVCDSASGAVLGNPVALEDQTGRIRHGKSGGVRMKNALLRILSAIAVGMIDQHARQFTI